MIKETLQIFDLDNNSRKNVSYETVDKLISAYDPKNEHQAPITIGHPKDDSPSYGLVGSMFRKGKDVFANVSYIPEFAEMLGKGLYKFVSLAFKRKYKSKKGETPYIRHLAFTPIPAITGMKTTKLSPITFADDLKEYDDLGEYEFNSKEEIKKKECSMEITQEQLDGMITSAVNTAVTKAESRFKTEFSDQITTLETDTKDLKTKLKSKETEVDKMKKNADDFADQAVENRIDVIIAAGIREPADKEGLMGDYAKYKEKNAGDLFADILTKMEDETEKKLEPGSHFDKKKDLKKQMIKQKKTDIEEEEQKFHDDLGHSEKDIEQFANMDSFSIVQVGVNLNRKEMVN